MAQYYVFNSLISGLNDKPFLLGLNLLEQIGLEFKIINSKENDFGTDFEKFNPNLYKNYFTNLLKDIDGVVITLEDSSFYGFNKYSKDKKVLHINQILFENLDKLELKNNLKDFRIAVYSKNIYVQKTLQKLNATLIQLENEDKNCGFFLKNIDYDLACKKASEILFEAYDSGADFMAISDIVAFDMFDTNQKNISKIMSRSFGNGFEIFSLSELLSLCQGKNWISITNKHSISVKG